jgi:hypothetical protein
MRSILNYSRGYFYKLRNWKENPNDWLKIIQFNYLVKYTVALGGLVVSVLATGPKVRGFDPERGRWIFKGHKNPAHQSSEGK